MARKEEARMMGRSGLKVVKATPPPQPQPGAAPAPPPEQIFGDKRSGRDRREEAGAADDSRRTNAADRRRGNGAAGQGAWWLERDYVESHHFVQKAASPRARSQGDEDAAP